MANTKLKLKKSSVAGRVPGSGDLDYGEIAINYNDGKLYYKNSSNAIKSFLDSAGSVALTQQYSVDSSEVLNLIDSDYVSIRTPGVNTDKSFNTYEYIADSAQTSFSGYDADSNELSYSVDNLEVYHNGVHLSTTDFTATNGTSVVLNQGAAINDELVITALESFTVASVATNIPFFKADGTQDNIALVSSALPFFKANGTQDNIGVI